MINISISINPDNNMNINTPEEKQEEVKRILIDFFNNRYWYETLPYAIVNDQWPLYDRDENPVGTFTINGDCDHVYSENNRCGANVCLHCEDHVSLDGEQQFVRCFCGWSKSGNDGYYELEMEYGETIEPEEEIPY